MTFRLLVRMRYHWAVGDSWERGHSLVAAYQGPVVRKAINVNSRLKVNRRSFKVFLKADFKLKVKKSLSKNLLERWLLISG